MSATMTPQFVADALIMAMPAKWRSVCTLSLLEKRGSRTAIAAARGFPRLWQTPLSPAITCGYLQIQYGIVGL
jgi:hypothetical protein